MADIPKITEDDDPNRCQAVTTQGQCRNVATKAEDGSYGKFCLAHGGNRFLQSKEKEAVRNYQLTKFKAKLQRHSSSDNIKSLRDEIGILRMCMEERLNKCQDEADLLLQSGPISDLVMKIDKVVTSCHKLDGSMGQLLDRSAILQFASEVIDIIGSEDIQTDILERIGNKIMSAVGHIGGEEEDASI